MAHYIAVKINAGLDGNGNGRRGYLVYERPDTHHRTGPCVAFVQDDGRGVWSLDDAGISHEFVDVICDLNVPVSEYRRARFNERDRVAEHGDIRTRLTAA